MSRKVFFGGLFLQLFVLAWLSVKSGASPYFSSDLLIAQFVQSIEAPALHALMRWVSLPGTGANSFVVAFSLCIVLWFVRSRSAAAILLFGLAIGGLMGRLLKSWVGRPRPSSNLLEVWIVYPHESFPSGHVVFYMQLFGFLLFLLSGSKYRHLWALVFLLPVVLVGVSRIYLGAHWPSDVLGGYLLGAICLSLMLVAAKREHLQN